MLHIMVYYCTSVQYHLDDVDVLQGVHGVLAEEVPDINDVLVSQAQQYPHLSQSSLKLDQKFQMQQNFSQLYFISLTRKSVIAVAGLSVKIFVRGRI